MDREFILTEKLPFVNLMSSKSTFSSIWYHLFMNVSHLDGQSLPLVSLQFIKWGENTSTQLRASYYVLSLLTAHKLPVGTFLTSIPSGKKSYL